MCCLNIRWFGQLSEAMIGMFSEFLAIGSPMVKESATFGVYVVRWSIKGDNKKGRGSRLNEMKNCQVM